MASGGVAQEQVAQSLTIAHPPSAQTVLRSDPKSYKHRMGRLF